MRFEEFSFGSIRINGTTYEHDVVIDRGHIRKRNKKPSKKFRGRLWTYTSFTRRRYTLEVPAARDRYWHRGPTGYGRGEV